MKKTVKNMGNAEARNENNGSGLTSMEREFALMKSVLDNSSTIIFVKDENGRFAYVNKHFRQVHGLGELDVSGLTAYDLLPKDLAEKIHKADRGLLENGISAETEKEIAHADGTKHTYINQKFPIPGFTGYIGGISTEITERKKMEEELRHNEELLSSAMRLSGAGVCEWSLKGNTYRWANETYDLFGVNRQSFVPTQQNVYDLVVPEDVTAFKETIRTAIKEKQVNFEARYRLKGKEGRLLHEMATITYDSSGNAEQVTGLIRDITEMSRMEEELVRTQKLEGIGELAGGIAHDINNHLQGIIGTLSIAKLKTDDENLQRIFDQMEGSANRTRDITKRLLTFSSGGGPIRAKVHLEGIIRESASMALHGSETECNIDIADDLNAVNVDEGQISQVFNNIIINARHAMNDGGSIEIKAVNTVVDANSGAPLAPGDYVLASIKDNGPGMDEKVSRKIFFPFFTTKEKASGLGLAISFSILKKHNGHIGIQSAKGNGSTFLVYLPSAGPIQAFSAKNMSAHAQKEIAEERAEEKRRILVMDDEEVVRDVSGEMIQLLGYDAEFAVDGDEAIKKYANAFKSGRPYDAVIMDLSVPGGIGGKDAIKRIKEIDPNVKAIVSSGYSKDPIMENYNSYGFTGVITKPYRVADFKKVIKSVVEG